MRQNGKQTSSKMILLIVGVFFLDLLLLFSLGKFWIESRRTNLEIELIRAQNVELEAENKEGIAHTQYLETDERNEKEAKIQLGKAREGEKVLVIVRETPFLTPTEKRQKKMSDSHNLPIPEQWRRLFLPKF